MSSVKACLVEACCSRAAFLACLPSAVIYKFFAFHLPNLTQPPARFLAFTGKPSGSLAMSLGLTWHFKEGKSIIQVDPQHRAAPHRKLHHVTWPHLALQRRKKYHSSRSAAPRRTAPQTPSLTP
jgi:hypothetical protein